MPAYSGAAQRGDDLGSDGSNDAALVDVQAAHDELDDVVRTIRFISKCGGFKTNAQIPDLLRRRDDLRMKLFLPAV